MGARKQRWTDVEEKALREGVGKHGTGKWKQILTDPEFAGRLRARSNVDLKDKWRNMAVGGLTRKIMKNGEAAYAETSPGGKLDEKMSRGGKLYDEMSQGGKLDEEMSRGGKLYEEKHTLDALRALQGDRNGKQTNAILDHFMSKQKLLPHFKRFKKLSSMGIIHKLPTLSAAKPSHVQAELRKMNDTSIIGVWKTVQAKAMSALVRDNVQEAEFADESTSFVEARSSLVHPSDGTVVVCS